MLTPLNNVKVLDFTHLLPGELCSTVLSDLGCEIVRVEALEPGLAKRLPPVVEGESLYYWSLHRNKERIAVDLKKEAGVNLIHRLVKDFDVVLENFRPGVMDRLGIGYETLSRINPGIVFCSISGYGQTSSWSQRPGHDLNFVAESGVLNQHKNEQGKPVLPGILISDYMAALYGALSIVSALFERATTGKGKRLDISMFECALSTLNILATGLLYTGVDPVEGGFNYPSELPNYRLYECKDGRFLAVASLEPPFWQRFCERIQRPDLISKTVSSNNKSLIEEISEIIRSRTLTEWVTIFEGSDCCVSPVNSLQEALSNLPTRERQLVTHTLHPRLGKIPQIATPVFSRFGENGSSETNMSLPTDTGEVLKHLGLTQSEIKELTSEKVIAG